MWISGHFSVNANTHSSLNEERTTFIVFFLYIIFIFIHSEPGRGITENPHTTLHGLSGVNQGSGPRTNTNGLKLIKHGFLIFLFNKPDCWYSEK